MLRYLPDLLLSVAAILLITIRLNSGSPASTPLSRCSSDEQAVADRAVADRAVANRAVADASGAVELNAWLMTFAGDCGLANTLMLAAHQIDDRAIQVNLRVIETLERFAKQVIEQAAVLGAAPDIVYLDNEAIVPLAQQGYLVPLDDCHARHAEFAGVHKDIWTRVAWEGKTWGVPTSIGVDVLFFNQDKLRALNWPAAMIESLPERIRTGEWTLDDMLDTIRQARALGVNGATEGFWPSYHRAHTLWLAYFAYQGRMYDAEQAKLVVSRQALVNAYRFYLTLQQEEMMPSGFSGRESFSSWPNGAIWRDAEAHGQPLFWQASTRLWPNFVAAAPEIGEAGLWTHIGLALFPSAVAGSPGYGLAHNFNWYAITSERASGRRQQDAACALLAKTLLPEVHALNLRQSGGIGALKTPMMLQTFPGDEFSAHTAYLWDYAAMYPTLHPSAELYEDIVVQGLARVESGELPPQIAVDAAILRLQNEVGDAILVE